jgi:signal transduction histidine kinase
MTESKPTSLSGRLTRLSVLVTATGLLLACAAFVAYDFVSIRNALVSNLSIQAQVLGSSSVAALMFNDRASAENTLGALRAAPNVVAASVYTAEGVSFAAYRRDPAIRVPARMTLPNGDREAHWFDRGDVMLVDSIAFQGKLAGYIFIESDLELFWARMRRYLLISVCVLVGALVVAVGVSTQLRREILRPIESLAEVARHVSQERNYSVRAGGNPPAELAVLVEAFNDMLAQIELRDRGLREAHDELERRVEQRTGELAAANKELESFSYSVSHDLRAPLRSIDGFSLALLQDYGDLLNADARNYLERVRAGTRRMGVLIEDMLNLARVTRAEMRRERVNLSAMAHAILADLRKGEHSRRVECVIEENVEAEGDAPLLRVALDNLLGNAWKYTSRHPCARIEFGEVRTNGARVFYVRDDGAGFDPAYAGKLFGAFQRLHGSAEFPGTGVGLATVQRIVHRHGGRIWAESEVEKGATFYFTV